MIQAIFQYSALAWLAICGLYNLLVMIGATLNAKPYSFGRTDVATGVCLFCLLVLGLPPLGIAG